MKKFISKGLQLLAILFLTALAACTNPVGTDNLSQVPGGDFFQENGRAIGGVPFDEGASIYQIMVDRFYDGNTSNNGPTTDGTWGKATNVSNQVVETGDKWYWKYRLMNGGDWKGITAKMEYIKGMGYKAIWISPTAEPQMWSPKFLDNGSWITLPSAYHGYNAKDPTKYNHYYGTNQDLIDLVNAAHTAGMSVIIDTVPNHVGDYLPGSSGTYTQNQFDVAFTTNIQPDAPWNNSSYYNLNGDINWNLTFGTYDDKINYMQNHDLAGLDDFNFDNATAKNAIFGAIKTVLTDIGADAMRIDAAKMMRPSQIHELEVLTGHKSFGENFDSDAAYVGKYVSQTNNGNNAEWGMLDFPLYDGIINTFAWEGKFTDANSVAKQLELDYNYGGKENRMVTFLDSHDRNRFLSYTLGNVNKLHQALIFMFTARGIPVVFQGTETNRGNDGGAALSGGIADTLNRWSMFGHDASGNTTSNMFVTTTNTYQLIKQLNGFKDFYPSLKTGKQREMWRADNQFAYSRRIDSGANIGQESVIIFNTSAASINMTIPMRAESTLSVGTVLYNAFDATKTDKVTIAAGGATGKQIIVTIPANSSKVLVQDSTPIVPPAAPTGLTVTNPTSTSLTVNWTASSGATSYTVYKSTASTSGFTSAGSTSGTSLPVTGLTPATTYYFYVTASNSAGTSPNSATVSGVTSQFTSTYPSMYLRGTMNSWGGTAMALTGNNTWTVSVSLTSGTAVQYKYDAYNNWSASSNWGDNNADGIGDLASGTNISYTPASTGSYTFSFNDSTKAYTVTPASSTVATPTFSPTAGAVTIGTVVTMSSATVGATIYYTTNGTTPTTASSSGTSVTVNTAMTIKAIAVKTGLTTSSVGSAAYTILGCATPTFNPPAGAVTAGTVVTISSTTPGVTIRYTTDGSTPTASSTAGTSVTVSAGMTIKAIAIKTGYTTSAVGSATYTITTKIANQLSIIFKTGTTAENVSFPGDHNSWNLTPHQLNVGANTTNTLVIANGVTASAIAQGSSTTALELKLCTAASWNNQWTFSTWSLGAGISLTDSGRQITIICNAGDQVDLTVNVATKTLSYVKK